MRLLLLVCSVCVLAVGLWVTRYAVVAGGANVYRLDRWTGTVRSEADTSVQQDRRLRDAKYNAEHRTPTPTPVRDMFDDLIPASPSPD